MNELRPFYSAHERKRVEQLAQVAHAFSVDFQRDPSSAKGSFHPLAGVLGRSYYYGAFIPRRGEPKALGILRSLLLRVITRRTLSQDETEAAKTIRDVLTVQPTYAFDGTVSSILTERWHLAIESAALTALLRPYFEDDAKLATAFALQALATKYSSTDPPSASPEPPSTDDPGKPRSPPSPGRPLPRVTPGGLTSIPTFVPPSPELEAPPTNEIPAEDLEGFQLAFALDIFQEEDEPLELPTKREVKLAIFEFDQLTRHHLEGALLPDSDRVLSSGESARVWGWLLARFSSSSSCPPMEMAAHICLALMLVTGRRRDECIYAIRNYLGDSMATVEGSLRVTDTGWTGTIPQLPELRGLPESWFDRPVRELDLPFAKPLAGALSRLAGMKSLAILDQIGATESWAHTWTEVRDKLRSEVPRFTETRLMHTLPVAVFLVTGHLREPQWLAGSSLEHSLASSHYYATPATRLRTIYSDALTSFGIELSGDVGSAHILVGAPRAAVRFERAQIAFSAMVSSTSGRVRLSKAPLPVMVDGVAALGLYLAILFGATTANRFTAPIAQMTRRHFLSPRKSGPRWTWAMVADKTTEPELDARICVLPELFTRQLEGYVRQLERLQRQLEKNEHENVALLASVRGALSGDGAFWFAVTGEECSYATQPLTPHAIASAWPEWAVPLPLLRHLFASNAVKFNLAGSDIALQMGHSIGGTPFNECDPDSPFEFAERLADGLQLYLHALGCELIGTVTRYDPPADLAAPPADSIISAYRRLAKARRDRSAQSRIRPDEAERLRGIELARACVEQATKDKDWLVPPEAIQTLLEEINEEPLPIQQATREALNTHIAKAAVGHGGARQLRRPYVPPLHIPDRAHSALALVNLDATRWSLELEKICLTSLDRGLGKNDVDATLAATVLLLALYGAGTTQDRILRLLDPTIPLHTFDGFERGVIAEVPLSSQPGSDDVPECQLLTGDVVPLIAFQRRCRTRPPTIPQLDTALRAQPELRPFLSTAKGSVLADALLLVGLARQAFLPGTRSAWERGALQTVGLALERACPLFGAQAPAEFTPAHVYSNQNNQFPARASGLNEYRSLRRLVHDLNDASKRRVAVTQLAHRHQQLTDRFGATSLIALLAALVVYLRDERQLADSTAYDYLVAIGRRLITHVGAGNIFDIESDDFEAALRQIAIEERSGGTRRGIGVVAPAIAHFARVLARVGFDLDLARVFDGLDVQTPRQPGYVAVQWEIDAIVGDLAVATDTALDTLALDTSADTAALAEAAIRIQMSAGLRLRETAGLMRRDLHLQSALTVHVHPTRRRGLKTLSSRRLVSVPIDVENTSRIQALLPRLARSSNLDSDLLLAAPGMGIPAVARAISTAFRRHASMRIMDRHARSHVARHNHATAAILATHPTHTISPLQTLKPVAGLNAAPARLHPVRHVPRCLQLRYLSRQMGHATPRTTLIWYAHSITLLHSQVPPWAGLPRGTEAALLGYPATHIDRWRTHRGATDTTPHLSRWNSAWLPAALHKRQPPKHETPAATIPTSNIALTAELAGRVALYVREGIATLTGAYHCGVSLERYRVVVDLLGEHDRGLRLNYLTGRRRRARSRLRIPRAHDQGPALREIDVALTECRIKRDDLRRWLLKQLSQPTDNDLLFDRESEELFNLLSRHKRMQRRTGYGMDLVLEKADRRHLLLALAVICMRTSA
ncbi:hypothetical protein [Salinisphaera sp.]|uniref:hypothetical protein n=1 Tax=Salinisphaera sp. TaxID=1914330 RepID=UPI0025F5E759|nr:hypothetical protein [Salinisphaera sp.]